MVDAILELARKTTPVYPDDAVSMTGAEAMLLRRELGLSQDWVADRLGMNRNSLKRWEKSNNPVVPDLANLLVALSNEASEIVDVVADAYAEGVIEDPLVIWTDERDFQAIANFRYTTEWHQAICRRVLTRLIDVGENHLLEIHHSARPPKAEANSGAFTYSDGRFEYSPQEDSNG